jgi:hypothetical protein
MTKLSQTMTSFEAMALSASSVIQDHQNTWVFEDSHQLPSHTLLYQFNLYKN